MKRFETISRELIEERLDLTSNTVAELIETTQLLKTIKSFTGLNDEDFKKLEEAKDILIKAMDNIEDELEKE